MTAKRVYFFSTCLVEHLHPEVGFDAIELLRHCGVESIFPEYQSCCAQPAFNSGDIQAARTVAERTVQLLSAEELPVVVPSASCADMLMHQLPKLLSGDRHLHDLALNLSKRCIDLLDFLASNLPQLPSTNETITLHLSCASLRGSGSAESWITAATKAGLEVQLPAYAKECCGFGGTFSVKAPEISTAMGQDKCSYIAKTGCSDYFSGDLGCLIHLNGLAEKNGLKIQGKHLVALLRKRYCSHTGAYHG